MRCIPHYIFYNFTPFLIDIGKMIGDNNPVKLGAKIVPPPTQYGPVVFVIGVP